MNELFLVYQPVVDVATRTIVGLEALVRWRHPDRGVLEPAAFIEVAEQTGLIVPLGRQVLTAACRQEAAWVEAGWAPLDIGVNISARQIADPGLLDDVATVLRETGLDP